MAGKIVGRTEWGCTVDDENHREYKITFDIETTDVNDGPFIVMQTPGLPKPGSVWKVGNDLDMWAWCRFNSTIKSRISKEKGIWWQVEKTFSTKPLTRCQDEEIKDPLLEPPKISGSFVKYTEEAVKDRHGKEITNSAHEQIRGPKNEWDMGDPVIRIEQNVATSYQAVVLPAALANHVNSGKLWGLGPRTIKLVPGPWERKFHGLCYMYFTRVLEFEIKYDTWDRDILDEGTKVLHGEWHRTTGLWTLKNIGGKLPDKSNPAHFDRAVDKKGNPLHIVLDGEGKPVEGVEEVIDCGYCGGGTAKFWKMEGWTGMPGISILNTILEHKEGCTWEATVGQFGEKVVLTIRDDGGSKLIPYVAPFNQNIDPEPVDIWQNLQANSWQCKGVNKITKLQGGEGAIPPAAPGQVGPPLTITLTPLTANKPGKLHIEKYNEIDFTLLGIPLTF